MSNSQENPNDWDVATKLIRGGVARTPYGETAEAMFLTQSFVYESAGQADARYINVKIQKKFVPSFGTKYFPGANSDGTFTLKSDAGIRTQ